LHAEPYKQDTETEFLVGTVAEQILPLRQPGKKRRKAGLPLTGEMTTGRRRVLPIAQKFWPVFDGRWGNRCLITL
jgi:hypothetical protein